MNRIARPTGRINETLLFSLTQLLYWSGNCVLYAFVVMFLKENGFSDIMCGITSALLSGMSLVIQPLMGYVTDTYITGKKLLIGCFVVAIPFTLVLPYTASLGIIFVLAVTVLSFFDNYQHSMIDAWIIKLKPRFPDLDFSRIRSFGSLGYGFTALAFGNIISKFGYDVMFYAHSLLLTLALLCLMPLPEAPCLNKGNKDSGTKKLSFIDIIKMLIVNKKYIILLISVCFYQFAIRPTVTLMGMIILASGGNSTHLGMATFACSAFEFPVMLAVSAIIRKGIKMPYLFAASLLIATVRLFVLSLPLGIWPIILMQTVGAVSMGIYISVFTQYISQITPSSITASATTIGTAFTFGLGGVFGNLMSGFLTQWFGMNNYIRICTVVMFIAFLLFIPNVIATIKEKP